MFDLNDDEIPKLEIPTGNPLLIELENSKISNCKYLDEERAKDLLVYWKYQGQLNDKNLVGFRNHITFFDLIVYSKFPQ